MNTIAQDVFQARYKEVRRKLLSRKIRNKDLVLVWLRDLANKTAVLAEKEVDQLMQDHKYKRLMGRQSEFEQAILKEFREDNGE